MAKSKTPSPLSDCITTTMEQYFKDLNGEKPTKLHAFFTSEVERPFLMVVMEHVEWNQTLAADMLGINRNTLRKKLLQYSLI